MKKLVSLVVVLLAISMIFSGCTAITNIFDPLPDNYVDGVKVPKEYPDDYLEIYDDAVVYEADEDDGEVALKCGTEDDIDDVVDFFEDLFEEEEFTLDEKDDSRGEFFAEGTVAGYSFEIFAEDASGDYEERAFATVIEVTTKQLGKDTLDKMQGFWLACGFDGVISDETRRMGMGLDIDDMKIDSYTSFEVSSTNIVFSFIDDKTIVYTDDGEQYYPEISFETIDGIDVMTMEYEGDKVHLEKSSMQRMQEYASIGADTLAQMQGFWLACGIDGEIDDTVRMQGTAVVYTGNIMSSYTYFEMDDETYVIEFMDDSTITYYDSATGSQEELAVTFETIDGIDVMTLSDGDVAINFEKSSEEDMWVYEDMGGEEGAVILLSDDLSDTDIESIFVNAPWTFVYVYDPVDGSYSLTEINETITFYSDYSGMDIYEGSELYFTWYILDSIIYITFTDGSQVDFWIDLEFDGTDVYVYLFDSDLPYETYAAVYMIIS